MAAMNQERVLSSAVVVAAVILLVLATLQYRWSRQVGEAVRERFGSTLKASMLDWHLDLLRELSGVCMAVRGSSFQSDSRPWQQAIEDYEQWSATAADPRLVENLFVLERRKAGGVQVYKLNLSNERAEAAELPARFADLPQLLQAPGMRPPGERMAPPPGAPGEGPPSTGCAFAPEHFALVRPLPLHVDASHESRPIASHSGWLLFVLSKEVLRAEILPKLAQRYFSSQQGLDYTLP